MAVQKRKPIGEPEPLEGDEAMVTPGDDSPLGLAPYVPITGADQIRKWREENEGLGSPEAVKSPTAVAPGQPPTLEAPPKMEDIRRMREDPNFPDAEQKPDPPHSLVPELMGTAGGIALSNFPAWAAIPPARALAATAGGAGGYFLGDMYDIATDPQQHFTWPRLQQAFTNARNQGVIQGAGEIALPFAGQLAGAAVQHYSPLWGQPMAYAGRFLSPASQAIKEAYQSLPNFPMPFQSPLAGPQAGQPAASAVQRGIPHPSSQAPVGTPPPPPGSPPGPNAHLRSHQRIHPDVKYGEAMLEEKGMPGGFMLSQRTPYKEEKSWAGTLEGFSTGGGGSGPVIERRRRISEKIMEGVLEEGHRMKNISFSPADTFYDRIRAEVGRRDIVEVFPIIRTLMDPRNAEGNAVVQVIRNRYSLDPVRYGRLYQELEKNGQYQGAGTISQPIPFDDAITLKTIFGEIGYDMERANPHIAKGAREFSEAVDQRIFQGLAAQRMAVQRLGPHGRNMGLPLEEQYLLAKRVDKNLHDTKRLGEMVVNLADPITGKMASHDITNAVTKFDRDELIQHVGKAGLAKLTTFQNILGMAERKSDETGRLVIAMNWAPAAIAAGSTAWDLGQTFAGNREFSWENLGKTGGKAAFILLTPNLVGRLMTNEAALLRFKREVAYAARQKTPDMTMRAIHQINTGLLADLAHDHAQNRPDTAVGDMPTNPQTGAVQNPATMLPNPVGTMMSTQQAPQGMPAVNHGAGAPSLGSKVRLPLTPDENEFVGRQIGHYGQGAEGAIENLRQVRKIMQADRNREEED